MKRKILLILFFLVLLIVCRLSVSLVGDDGKLYYKGKDYIPVQHYMYIRLSVPIGTMNDALVYKLANDPDTLFLYPKTFLTLSYCLFAQRDVRLPVPTQDTISQITINGTRCSNELKECLVTIIQESEHTKIDRNTPYKKTYYIEFLFEHYPQVSYTSTIYEYQSTYGLLLDEANSIVEINAEVLEEVIPHSS